MGGVIGGVALLIAVVFLIRLKCKRRHHRIQKTDIQLIPSLHDPEIQNTARQMFLAGPQYTNLPSPPQPPTPVSPTFKQSKTLEPRVTTPQRASTPQKTHPPERPMKRPESIPGNVLKEIHTGPTPDELMGFMRHSPGSGSLDSSFPGSYLGRSELGTPNGFRDGRRDTRESYGLRLYRQQSFNRTLAEEHPELYSTVQDDTRNLSLKPTMERNLPLDQLGREYLYDPAPKSSNRNSPLHYSNRISQLSPPPLRIKKNEGHIPHPQGLPSEKGSDGDLRYLAGAQVENIQDLSPSSDDNPEDQFYKAHTSIPGSETNYLGTPTTYTGSTSGETYGTVRESQIPLSKEALELDRINTQRRLGGLAPLPDGTPSSEWRTSEAPPRKQNNLPSPKEIPRINVASSVYPESEVPMPINDIRYLGDHVDRSRLGGMYTKDGNFGNI